LKICLKRKLFYTPQNTVHIVKNFNKYGNNLLKKVKYILKNKVRIKKSELKLLKLQKVIIAKWQQIKALRGFQQY
jgi:GTPase involved in cell partitioning and DNA repair